MDTFKDRQQLEEIYGRGNAPWQLWNANGAKPEHASAYPTLVPINREPAGRVRLV